MLKLISGLLKTNLLSIQLNESNTKLIINNISKNDQAIYQCFLSNEAGHISASTLIKIISMYLRIFFNFFILYISKI